jgi:hypothetical protein
MLLDRNKSQVRIVSQIESNVKHQPFLRYLLHRSSVPFGKLHRAVALDPSGARGDLGVDLTKCEALK